MTESFNPEPVLPEVNESDLFQVLVEGIADPTHEKRWNHLVETNPVLARVMLEHAYRAAHQGTPVEATKEIVDTITLAVSALEAAILRVNIEQPSDDRGDEVLPPSV